MSNEGVKRKKKSFLQRTRKFYKKGSHGQGIRVEDETFEYFLHVLKIMNQEFESDEDKQNFIDNVFEQLSGNEVEYSRNQVISRIIDNLLPLASNQVIAKFMNTFEENIRSVCVDPFASHVLQKLLTIITKRYLDAITSDQNDKNDDETIKIFEWLTKISKFVLNNYEEFVFDNYANHIMRTVCLCLIGHASKTTYNLESLDTTSVPIEFTEILKTFVDQILHWSNFKELPYEQLSSAFLQDLIRCIVKVDMKRTKLISRKLLRECFIEKRTDTNDQSVVPLFDNEPCVRLLETILSVAPAKIFTNIYNECFTQNWPALAYHPVGNFTVQKLIEFCSDKVQFEEIFDQLSNSFEEIMQRGKKGVIVQLCKGCVRHKTKQSIFMQLWMKYLNCNEPQDSQMLVTPLTIFLQRKSEYDSQKIYDTTLYGSLLTQYMLKFNKPIKVINSFLNIDKKRLEYILCNHKGSHIADAFFESEFVGEKSREKFLKILEGSYVTLATSRHGSRVFDIVWNFANVKNRASIAAELLKDEAKLSNNQFGRPISYTVSLGTFRRNKEDWIKAQTSSTKAKKLFANIVSDL